MRDWYFNAGIVGFLRVVSDDCEDLSNCAFVQNNSLIIGENYIEFDGKVLEEFVEKFYRLAFLDLFNIKPYLHKLQNIIEDLSKNQGKFNLKEALKNLDKFPFKNFSSLYQIGFYQLNSVEDLKTQVQKNLDKFESYTSERFYNELISFPEGTVYIKDYFLPLKFKGICGLDKLPEYINEIIHINDEKKLKNGEICLSCQERKVVPSFEFSNSISNVIGFNKDNSNWVWGYKPSKLNLCGVCALIYSCAFLAFAYITKKSGSNYLNYFYFLNYNTDVNSLYRELNKFNELLHSKDTSSLYVMIKQTILLIKKQQIQKIAENIHFLEIAESEILGGQSTSVLSALLKWA
jgi:CRISPR-associated protein Cst1